MESEDTSKWIMPPGLLHTAKQFDSFFKTLFGNPSRRKNPPVMITGPRGVGKTLFTKIFGKRYRERDSGVKKTERINIASLNENLIESELFGHIKGAFTGALRDKKGLIEKTSNGILILEEIGALPKWVQAKLLTFIEDGYYRKVGEEKVDHAENVQIIATTNKEIDDECFMKDFLDRFQVFKVPPLHERRGDILYYFYNQFPDLISILRPYIGLTLLAYNWPGNIREVERVGYSVEMAVSDPWLKDKYPVHFIFQKETRTSIDPFSTSNLSEALRASGVNINFLEKELRRFGLGLLLKDEPSFPKKIKPEMLDEESKSYNVDCYRIKLFDSADEGLLRLYCPLFHQPYF